MASKASISLRALIHSEVVLAVEAQKAAVENELAALLAAADGVHPSKRLEHNDAALRALETGQAEVKALRKNEMQKLMCLASPPYAVLRVAEVLLLLLNAKPGRCRDPDTGRKVGSWWLPFKKVVTAQPHETIKSMLPMMDVLVGVKAATMRRVRGLLESMQEDGGLEKTRRCSTGHCMHQNTCLGAANGGPA